jgi:hypothetical protein
MPVKTFFVTLFVAITHCGIAQVLQDSTDYSSYPLSENPVPGPLLHPGFAGNPCAGSTTSSSNPFQPGMFRLDGDFENFRGSSHGTNEVCVSTDFTNTHEVATLQDASCSTSLWRVSHGTPEVGFNIAEGSPFIFNRGNHFIHLWAGDWDGNNDFEGEGIFYDCSFLACEYYKISLRLSSTGLIKKVFFYLAEGLVHKSSTSDQFKPESDFYNVPAVAHAQLLHTITNFNSTSWVDVQLPGFMMQQTGLKLWIYTEDDNKRKNSGIDLLFIDALTDGLPGSSSTCDGIVTITNGTAPSFVKGLTITASGSSTTAPNSFTEFQAGSSITLLPNFHTGPNASFNAHIVPCVSANNCPSELYVRKAVHNEGQPDNAISDEHTAEKLSIVIFPNPAQENFTLKLSEPAKVVAPVLIYDVTGRVVRKEAFQVGESEKTISADTFTSGLYRITVNSNGTLVSQKVIINHR